MTAPNSPYKTLSNIRSAVIKDAKEATSSQIVTLVDRWINEGHEQVTLRKKRDWLDQQFTVQLSAAVQETCSVTENSRTVTFTAGTTFPIGAELQFSSRGFEEIYNVASATLNVITLDKPYLGTSNTASSGVVFQPSILLDASIRMVYSGYHQYQPQPLIDVGPQLMRQIQEAGGIQLNEARYMTIFGQNASGSRRLKVYPYPLNAYTLYLDVNTFPSVLSADADEPQIPIQYRQILYWYGIYKLWLYQRNADQANVALTNFNSMLARIDGEMRAELDFPRISVSYPRRTPLRQFITPFDTRLRDDN
jgi:hypothetical protein